jgi:ATP-binding cassette, subfamily B, multidrug efflux pump
MSNQMKEEDSLGKAFDLRLMKRLLKYAKPFAGVIALCVLLLMLITATELLRPKLIQIAIDDYIKGIDVPLIVYDQEPDYKNVEFDGKYYVRENIIKDKAAIDEKNVYQLIKYQDGYFMAHGRLNPNTGDITVTEEDNLYLIKSDKQSSIAQPLTKEQYLIFRKYN